MPVAEVAVVRRGTAVSAVYGTVRIEPAFVVHVRAQNSGFIQLAEEFSAGHGAIGKSVTKGELLASIADETTARQLKQARADLQAATERAKLPLPSEELLKAAEDNLHRLEQVVAFGNVPAVEYEKAKSEANQEDVGEVKPGMKAKVQLYAYRTQTFAAHVSSIQPAADPDTQRYTVILEMEKPPDNLMAGMTGEMNIITGTHENALLLPTRALLVDQALVLKRGIVQRRTIKVGFRTLDFAEALSGVATGDRVVVADQDRLRPGQPVRQRRVDVSKKW